MQACSVCECGADEVPKVWLDAETAGGAGSVEAAAGSGGGGECDADSGGRCDSVRCAAALDAPVDTSIEENMESRLLNLKVCVRGCGRVRGRCEQGLGRRRVRLREG
eukprot:366493-Chlamydomonas_euryale.AAC.5